MFLSPSISCFPFLLSVFLSLLSVVSLSSVRCFSFLSIGYFSFLVVEGCVCFLFTAHFYPRAHLGASTTWNTRLLPISYVRSALSARSIRDFIAEEWVYLSCQEGEENESRFLHT